MTEPRTEIDIPDHLRQLWSGAGPDRPGPKRGVDLHTIAATGVRIADESGLAAVSMRNIAAELGFTSMALYRYVRSKDDLIEVIVDEALGPPDFLVDPDANWRDKLTAWANAVRAAFCAHRWILQVPISEPPLTPNQIAWMERGLSTLAGTGLGHQERLSAMLLVDVYVRGQAHVATELGSGGVDAMAQYARRLAQLIDPNRFPELSAAMVSGALDNDADDGPDGEYRFGLDTVLDGIAARIAGHHR